MMRFGDWIGETALTNELSAKLQKAGAKRVVVSHAVGAADDGSCALVKLALFGATSELFVLPALQVYWLIDRIDEAVEGGAIRDLRAEASPDSVPGRQLALHAEARPQIMAGDWESAPHSVVTQIRAHAFGNALGLMAVQRGREALLILPDQVAILLGESLTLAATYLIDHAHPAVSHS